MHVDRNLTQDKKEMEINLCEFNIQYAFKKKKKKGRHGDISL